MSTGDIVTLTFDWGVLNDMRLSHSALQTMAIDGGEFIWGGRGYQVREVSKLLATRQTAIRCVDMGDAETLRAAHRERTRQSLRLAVNGGVPDMISYAAEPPPLPPSNRAVPAPPSVATAAKDHLRKVSAPPVVETKIKADPLSSTQRRIDVDWD